MLPALTDVLYGTNAAINWFKNKHPEEEIVFVSAATILEAASRNQIGWSLRRIFQRRGVVIITRNQIVLKDSLVSFYTFFWLLMLIYSLSAIFRLQEIVQFPEWPFVFWAFVSGILLLQRLPYQRQIYLKDIRELKLSPIQGILTTGSLLTVYLENRSINIIPAQLLKEDVIPSLAPRTG